MKKVKLSGIRAQGKYALVDDADFERVNARTWHISTNGYAQTFEGRKAVFMHRFIMKAKGRLRYVDHINQEKLDNRRQNLRLVSPMESAANVAKRKVKNGTSKYKGVSWSVLNKNWRVRVTFGEKEMWVGAFPTQRLAATAYNEAAQHFFGKSALLNTIQ